MASHIAGSTSVSLWQSLPWERWRPKPPSRAEKQDRWKSQEHLWRVCVIAVPCPPLLFIQRLSLVAQTLLHYNVVHCVLWYALRDGLYSLFVNSKTYWEQHCMGHPISNITNCVLMILQTWDADFTTTWTIILSYTAGVQYKCTSAQSA